MTSKPKIVIVGGGFGGLEAAYLLRMQLHDGADLFLVSDSERFLFKPNTIYIPFGADPETFYVPIADALTKRHITFYNERVESVDANGKHIVLGDGSRLPYDYLVLATGASMRPDEIPGLGEHAATIWTPDEMLTLRDRLETVRERALAGERQTVLFLVPPNNKCSGPLYEMVFMLETWLRREGIRHKVEITYSTFEKSYIQAFGPRLHDVVTTEFDERGIEGKLEHVAKEVTSSEVRYDTGVTLPYDVLIAFPPYVSAMTYETLPHDDRGFLKTELETRQVVGHPDIYAPGDGGDFPVKQAFLAFLQADAVANHIASRVHVDASGNSVRSREHVRHGDVRQGDVCAGTAAGDGRSGAAGRSAARRRRRVQSRCLPHVAAREESTGRVLADEIPGGRALSMPARRGS